MKPPILIYTDGSCLNNGSETAHGGWAAVLENDQQQLRISGHESPTTNNRMELRAILEGLQAVKNTDKPIQLFTDSAYARNGCKTWRHNWKSRGWLTASKKPVENVDLWGKLDDLLDRFDVELFKVRGHSGHPQNELADKLAAAAARQRTVKEYRRPGDYLYDWRELVRT